MRVRCGLLALAACFCAAAPAQAAVPHTVQPGETLWSIAAANNLTTRTVAAFNGLSENSQVVLGSTIMVPTTVEGYSALQRAGLVSTPASTGTTWVAGSGVEAPAGVGAPAGSFSTVPTSSGADSDRPFIAAIAFTDTRELAASPDNVSPGRTV